ncbi:Uncharacterized conserved protein, DUF58 family, contains vWF domain [Haloechinothrix alba]|uniref:Uncharacterized conserved protein, DUF58 family, contains vWF domain n=1 Tax=Haloechinothrix alba TaxID=664784 RepID=A0A238WGI0_9PSEU|nr:DUF58 domain-containing protein [Haloechinothrix alba]SNR45324.1 Uncharacterized conserved protein, DUF58 family, contains vWF domain [Haloechinothrix alba]
MLATLRQYLRASTRALLGLTTRGRCLLAAGVAAAVCAWVLNERELLRVATFIIALPLLAVLFLALPRVRIRAERLVRPDRIPVGAECAVRLRLWRSGRLPPVHTVLTDGVPYQLGSRPRFVVERLPRGRVVELTYPLRPALRGVHRITDLSATMSDPFGLCELDHDLLTASPLTVVPRTVELTGLPFGAGNESHYQGAAARVSGMGDPDSIVRQYRHGDDMRRVHWPSTARRDELMVRLEERPRQGRSTVLLDRRAAAHAGTGPASSVEWAVSFAASTGLQLRRSGRGVRLITEDTVPLVDVPSGGTPEHDELILDKLAAVQQSHERDIGARASLTDGGALIAVLGSLSDEAVHQLCRAHTGAGPAVAVLLDTPSWSGAAHRETVPAEQSARLFRASGWATCVVDSTTTIPGAWAELCRSAPGRPVSAGAR